MLRVDVRSLAWRNSEELRVELVNFIEESTTPCDGFTGQAHFRIAETLDIEAITRDIRHGIATFGEEFPKRFGVIDPAWEPAADSDDCDTFFWHN